MNVLDLFSGIGGFSLGLERAGMRTIAFCEIEPWCRAVLAKHWPGVPCADDVTTRAFREGEADVVCGGFPCQDISNAGDCAGLAGERSGLWRELLRAIRVVRPRFAIVENVAALLARGMGTVLGDLAEIGYDAEWHCIPASAVGAPHRRDRVWIIANPRSVQHEGGRPPIGGEIAAQLSGTMADSSRGDDGLCTSKSPHGQKSKSREGRVQDIMADANHINVQGIFAGFADEKERGGPIERQVGPCSDGIGWWSVEPDVGRVAHGVSSRVDRLKGLGNSVVPQIPEIIGRAIMNSTITIG